MKRLGLLCSVALLATATFASCAGDEKSRTDRDADAGAGGADATGAGGSSRPAAGEGGAGPAIAGDAGAPPIAGDAGMGPVTRGGEGGMAGALTAGEGGAGGAGGVPLDCPAQPGNFARSCGEIVTLWTPVFDSLQRDFVLHLDDLSFQIASGTLSYFYSNADFQECGTADITGVGTTAVASVDMNFSPTNVRVTAFELVDVCGNHYEFDQTGVACNELEGAGSFGTWDMACQPAPGICPEGCN